MPEEDISEIVRENPNTRIIISNYVEAEPNDSTSISYGRWNHNKNNNSIELCG